MYLNLFQYRLFISDQKDPDCIETTIDNVIRGVKDGDFVSAKIHSIECLDNLLNPAWIAENELDDYMPEVETVFKLLSAVRSVDDLKS